MSNSSCKLSKLHVGLQALAHHYDAHHSDCMQILAQQVYNGLGQDAKFDGGKLQILNYDGHILFTHELLQSCLDQQGTGRVSFNGFWTAKTRTFQLFLHQNPQLSGVYLEELEAELNKKSLADKFTNAVFAYLTLLEVNSFVFTLSSCCCVADLHLTLVHPERRLTMMLHSHASACLACMLTRSASQ